MSRSITASLALIVAALVPAACSSGSNETEQDAGEAQIASGPEAPAGVSVSDAQLTLPAVSGNPGALYFTISNSGESGLTIASASITGAGMAMFHQTVTEGGQSRMINLPEIPLPAGQEVSLAPGGMHVMAMQLDEALAVGGETEATLTFANGDKVSFPVRIVAPGTLGGEG
jgi:copper(I)-binding protein